MKSVCCILAFILLTPARAQNRFSHDKILRDIYTFQDERKTADILPFFTHKKQAYRLTAVMAMASVQDSAAVPQLLFALSHDKSTEVRRAAAYSLGQLYLPSLLPALSAEYSSQKHKDVKNALIEAIGKCASKQAIPFFEQVELKASIYDGYARGVYFAVRRKVKSDIVIEKIKTISTSTTDPALLRICTRILSVPKPEVPETDKKLLSLGIQQVEDSLKTISNPYQQISFLQKYSIYPEDLYQMTLGGYALPVKTYCMETYLKTAPKVNKQRLIYIMNSGNVAFISLSCTKILKDTVWHLADSFPAGVLKYVSDKLTLPRDLEAWIDVQKTIALVKKEPYVYHIPAFSHPINWAYVAAIPKMQKVSISTNKGDIIMVCKVNDAPASVGNFLALVDSGYYNHKYFHRMVPDFVVQGGCPRGDGWGSLNWIQRSEFSSFLRYKPGSAGLASAGKDSEGVQFFITHTYATNLDGRYTIFAEVVEGMEIVRILEVGDQILKIEKI